MLTKQAPRDNIYASDQQPAADPAYQSGLLHLQKKEYDVAIADLSEAIRHQPENTDVISSRADAYVLRAAPGDAERALADDQHMIDLTPDDPRVWATRADHFLTLKMPAKALADMKRAIFALPDAPRLYLMRANDEAALGDAAAALADRKTAETLEPGIMLKIQIKNNEDHIWQTAIITPDGPARLDPNWDKPLVTTTLVQRWHLSGAVPLMVEVGMDGKPENFKIVTSSGSALLDKAAILSAAEWGYLPATKKGKPESVEEHWIPVTVEYPKSADAAAVPDWPQPLPAEASAPQRLAATDDEIARNYPPLARLQQMEGNTQLDLLIGSDGTVQNIAVRKSSSHSLLDAAAFKLAETWRYAPAQVNGVPVPARITVSVAWKLPPQ
jgi:TonB family protein